MQNIVSRDDSNHIPAHIHSNACARTYVSILTKQNLIYTQLKSGNKQRLKAEEDSSTEWKTWQVYSFWKCLAGLSTKISLAHC